MTTMSPPRTYTILLVDDQPDFLALARELLAEHPGLQVVGEATDDKSAMELLIRLQPDVAILDVYMPWVSGFTLCRKMLDLQPNLRVIMTSSHDDRQYHVMAAKLGAKAFLHKNRLSARSVADILEPP